VNVAYKTLFYGLKTLHKHKVAVVHPLAFFLRRILYTVAIVALTSEGESYFGVIVLLLSCLLSAIFVIKYRPW